MPIYPLRSIIYQLWKLTKPGGLRRGYVTCINGINLEQQECDSRAQQIKGEEQNMLQNIQQAWQYNVNDPYYPSGKVESGSAFGSGASTFGGGTSAFGGGTTGGTFGVTTQSAFGTTSGTSSFTKPSSFGASPFGSMPASAFALGSRDQTSTNTATTTLTAFGTSNPSAFGNTTTTSAFGQPPSTSAFGQTTSVFGAPATTSAFGTSATPSTFGTSNAPSAFGAKSSSFGGGTSLPTAPLSSSTTTTFGQPSVLGVSSLPPPPTMGMSSLPAFGQTGGLGVLGATPAFGQTSSFSSPFAGGLGKSLGGGSPGATFGSKSSFGGFAQNNQPNAFAAAATGVQPSAFAAAATDSQPNAFLQASTSSQSSAFQAAGGGEFRSTNRFAELSEIRDNVDKDYDMADDDIATVVMEPSAPPTGSSTPVMPAANPFMSTQALPTVAETTSPQSLSSAFGGLSTSRADGIGSGSTPSAPEPAPVASLAKHTPVTTSALPLQGLTASAGKKPAFDEMAAWRADKFEIGMIPEMEPPLEVR